MLTRLAVDNSRTLVGFNFNVPNAAVIVGANGTGKSSICEVLGSLQDLVVRGHSIEDAFRTSSITRWQTGNVQTFAIDVRADDGTEFRYKLEVLHDRQKETPTAVSESLEHSKRVIYRNTAGRVRLREDDPMLGSVTIAYDRKRSFLAAVEASEHTTRMIEFRAFIARLGLFRLDPNVIDHVSKRDDMWLERDGSNFAAWYRSAAPADFEQTANLMAELKTVLPGFVALENRPSGGTSKELVAKFRREGKDFQIMFNELSDGQKVLVVIYAVLHLGPSGPAVFIIDEPENFVALPEIQPLLRRLMERVEQRGWQVLIMSHNAQVIDYMAAEAALELTLAPDGTTKVAPLKIDLDEGLRASEVVLLGLNGQGDDEASPT